MLARLRLSEPLAALTGVSVSAGGSGTTGAASSRARVLVDRRGSDILWVKSMRVYGLGHSFFL